MVNYKTFFIKFVFLIMYNISPGFLHYQSSFYEPGHYKAAIDIKLAHNLNV